MPQFERTHDTSASMKVLSARDVRGQRTCKAFPVYKSGVFVDWVVDARLSLRSCFVIALGFKNMRNKIAALFRRNIRLKDFLFFLLL